MKSLLAAGVVDACGISREIWTLVGLRVLVESELRNRGCPGARNREKRERGESRVQVTLDCKRGLEIRVFNEGV